MFFLDTGARSVDHGRVTPPPAPTRTPLIGFAVALVGLGVEGASGAAPPWLVAVTFAALLWGGVVGQRRLERRHEVRAGSRCRDCGGAGVMVFVERQHTGGCRRTTTNDGISPFGNIRYDVVERQHGASEMRARTARELGTVIRERRRELNLTQQQLAVRAKVGRTWLVAVEAGHPRAELDKVLQVLAVLDLTLDVSTDEPAEVDLDALLERHQPRSRRG
jgi:HTH-type transcriptional regulator / antitoxin HipB